MIFDAAKQARLTNFNISTAAASVCGGAGAQMDLAANVAVNVCVSQAGWHTPPLTRCDHMGCLLSTMLTIFHGVPADLTLGFGVIQGEDKKKFKTRYICCDATLTLALLGLSPTAYVN